MTLVPKDAKELKIENSTVNFYEFIQNGSKTYYFDSSECVPPEPMINAMLGLQLLKHKDDTLIMINHTAPNGLFPKIQSNYNFEILNIDNGKVEVTFHYKLGTAASTDFSDNTCG